MKQPKHSLKIFFLLLINSLFCQEFKPEILTLPEALGAHDFSFLKEELKDVHVLMLGENTHYDGNVFEAKTKMIEYLHKEMGFSTIAFESSIYDVWKSSRSIDQGGEVEQAIRNGLFSIWSEVEEFQSFIKFYETNKKNLKLFGFDSQVPNAMQEHQFVGDLFEYCERNHFALSLNREDLGLLIESLWTSSVFDEKDISYVVFCEALEKLMVQIERQKETEENFFWKQIIKSLMLSAKSAYTDNLYRIPSTFAVTKSDNKRDQQMAANLLAYIEKNPQEKIICWGASAHFTNQMNSVKADTIKAFIPMGSYLKTKLKDKVYSLAMVTAEDSIDLGSGWEKTPIQPLSFEAFLRHQKKTHLFISSSQQAMETRLPIRFFSPITFVEAQLSELHDGYLFFNNVKESTLIDRSIQTKEVIEFNKAIENEAIQDEMQLNEVVVEAEFTPGYIMKKVIKRLKKNYASQPFNSNHLTDYKVKVDDTLDFGFTFYSLQTDRGYDSPYRSTQKLENFQWIQQNNKKYKLNYFDLTRNFSYIHIRYLSFLSKPKYKKFKFQIVARKIYQEQEIFVVNFQTDREHTNYTQLHIPSSFSGELYISKEDFAILKIIANWKIKENTKEELYDIYGALRKEYPNRVLTNISSEYDFFKRSDGSYYLKAYTSRELGFLDQKEQGTLKWEAQKNSYWNNFKTDAVVEISFKQEQKEFKIPKYNQAFWKDFDIEKFKN